MLSCSKEPRPAPSTKFVSPNYNSGTKKVPDFKFELLPLHSQLLRQSRLVSFPPLIDMLKFSGYPYLIRGQPLILYIYIYILGDCDWVKKVRGRRLSVIISPQNPTKPKYPTAKFQWGGEICQTYSGQAQQTRSSATNTDFPPLTKKRWIRNGC